MKLRAYVVDARLIPVLDNYCCMENQSPRICCGARATALHMPGATTLCQRSN